jgi:hypothetical protein
VGKGVREPRAQQPVWKALARRRGRCDRGSSEVNRRENSDVLKVSGPAKEKDGGVRLRQALGRKDQRGETWYSYLDT